MLDWILSNLKLIVSGILVVISVVVFILRKRDIKAVLDSSATSSLIDLIIEAESKFGSGHGKEKLNYVLDAYMSRLTLNKDNVEWVRQALILVIEKILSTPSKK